MTMRTAWPGFRLGTRGTERQDCQNGQGGHGAQGAAVEEASGRVILQIIFCWN